MRTEKEKQKAGILGLGNLLLSDESFGVHVVEYLTEQYIFPESVTVLDGGTSGIYMAPFLEEHTLVLIVDVLRQQGRVPGSLFTFNADDIANSSLQSRMSPHQLGILEILDICTLREAAPEHVEFFCVVPETIETGLAMSKVVADQVEKTGNLLVQRLRSAGYDVQLRPDKQQQTPFIRKDDLK